MNLSEFKLWFEGFCEAVGSGEYTSPEPSQWETLKKKISEIEETTVTNNVLVKEGPNHDIKPQSPFPTINPDIWRGPHRIGTPTDLDPPWPKYPEIWCTSDKVGETGPLMNSN